MQIKKINSDKLKVILSSNDLNEKNINVDSFLSNSIDNPVNLCYDMRTDTNNKINKMRGIKL